MDCVRGDPEQGGEDDHRSYGALLVLYIWRADDAHLGW